MRARTGSAEPSSAPSRQEADAAPAAELEGMPDSAAEIAGNERGVLMHRGWGWAGVAIVVVLVVALMLR